MAYRENGQIFINASPIKKRWRTMTEKEIEEAAAKDWKKQTPPKSDDPSRQNSLNNLSGPKTLEGKKRALANLRPGVSPKTPMPRTHGGYVMSVLNEDEQTFYAEREKKYIADFELNESSDAVLLHAVLIEEVIMRRLMLYQSERPSADITRPLDACHKRLRDALKSLGMTREQRQGMKINVEHSIADLAARVSQELEDEEEESRKLLEEEEALLRNKHDIKRQEDENTIDAEYELVDDDEIDPDA